MEKIKNNLLNKKAGFSLVEIIVVLVIVGLLAAIAIPSFSNYIKQNRGTEAMGNLFVYKTQAENCLNHNIGHENDVCASLTFPSSPNFTYAWSTLPTNTNTLLPTGTGRLSPSTAAIYANALPSLSLNINFPGESTAYAVTIGPAPVPLTNNPLIYNVNGLASNAIIYSRDANGSWTCTGYNLFANSCPN